MFPPFTGNLLAITEFSLIIPKKAISEIQKLFFDKIEIYYDDTTLIAQSANFEFFTKLINGRFPDYNRVIPQEIKRRLRLSTVIGTVWLWSTPMPLMQMLL